jgi:predicted kinase
MRKSLIIFRGLPGTGKSYLINKVREYIPDIIVISRDVIRSKVFPNPTYSNEEKEHLLSIMLFMIEEHSQSLRSIILDGMTFATRQSFQPFITAAEKHNFQFRIIECFCSEETAFDRISIDVIEKAHLAADRNDDLYYHVKEIFEPVTHFHLKVNTDEDTEKNVEKIINYLQAKIVKLKDAD